MQDGIKALKFSVNSNKTIMKYFIGFFSAWLFTTYANAQEVGSKVTFKAVDGNTYTGIVKEKENTRYKIKYDGYEFESWLEGSQFSVITTTNTYRKNTTAQPQTNQAGSNNTADYNVYAIFNFGKKNGWASQIQENKLNGYLAQLSQQDKSNLVSFLNQAKTSSAKFFVLKSLLAGDNFTILQKFITQLNQYPETYQQEKCLVTTRRSIIQRWQYSCSVTAVQTFLGDLCPRYAWEVKQISNFDAIANDPNHPMAQQQKQLLEQYGGGASARGDHSGTAIGINRPLNDFVGKILGVTFYAQQ